MTTPAQFNTTSIQNFLTFPFRGPDWKNKFLLTCALGFASVAIPIVPMLPLLGYQAEIMRRAASSEEPVTLPEWTDWGKLFLDGLRSFGLILIVILPQFIFMGLWYASFMYAIFMGTEQDPETMVGMIPASIAIYFIGFFLLMIWSLGMGFFMPPAMTHAAVTRSFAAAFHVRQWWGIFKANFLGFIVGMILLMGTIYMLYMAIMLLYVTLIGCLLIPLATAPLTGYLTILSGALFGTVYREGNEKLAAKAIEPAPIAPEPAEIG